MKLWNTVKEKSRELYYKMVGEQASSTYIARGWAIGMFWGCICPFGLQLMCSIPTAFVLHGSKIGATLGTFITNHFSIFIIYPLQTYVGAILLGDPITYDEINSALQNVLKMQNFDALMATGTELVSAFFMGGALLTAIMTPITYFAVKYMVERFRKKKNIDTN